MAIYKYDCDLNNAVTALELQGRLKGQADFGLRAKDFAPAPWEGQEPQVGDIIICGGLVTVLQEPPAAVEAPSPYKRSLYPPAGAAAEWKLGHRD